MRRARQKRITKSSCSRTSACWRCGNARSGNVLKIDGHLRSLCEQCTRFGENEIELDGRLRELFSYVTWEGFIPHKHRRKVQLLTKHLQSEIAMVAQEMLLEDDFQRRISAAQRDRRWKTLTTLEMDFETWREMRPVRVGEQVAGRFA